MYSSSGFDNSTEKTSMIGSTSKTVYGGSTYELKLLEDRLNKERRVSC